jgi:hypothetical protein
MKALLPQKCPVPLLYLTRVAHAGLFVYRALRDDLVAAGFWLVAVPGSLRVYARVCPRISRFPGFGCVDDPQPSAVPGATG